MDFAAMFVKLITKNGLVAAFYYHRYHYLGRL